VVGAFCFEDVGSGRARICDVVRMKRVCIGEEAEAAVMPTFVTGSLFPSENVRSFPMPPTTNGEALAPERPFEADEAGSAALAAASSKS
jgi:hypothetical protein